jgi:uncharacterized protein (DUF1778 family)
MASRRSSVVIGTRVTEREGALIKAAATAEGVNVSQFVRDVIVPAVGERLARGARELAREGEAVPA